MDVRLLQINGIPPALKAKIAADADSSGKSMNDVMVGILAEKFGIAFDGLGGTPRARKQHADTTILRMPQELYTAIGDAADVAPVGQRFKNSVVLRTLHEHYGLRYAPVPGRPRRGRPAAAAG